MAISFDCRGAALERGDGREEMLDQINPSAERRTSAVGPQNPVPPTRYREVSVLKRA
jgi:hypothetical protein